LTRLQQKKDLREEEVRRAIRILSPAHRIHASSLHIRCRFDIERNAVDLPSGGVNEGFL
jgi:hypothetical protein